MPKKKEYYLVIEDTKDNFHQLPFTIKPDQFNLPYNCEERASLLVENKNENAVHLEVDTNSHTTLKINPNTARLISGEKVEISICRPKPLPINRRNEHLIFKVTQCICNCKHPELHQSNRHQDPDETEESEDKQEESEDFHEVEIGHVPTNKYPTSCNYICPVYRKSNKHNKSGKSSPLKTALHGLMHLNSKKHRDCLYSRDFVGDDDDSKKGGINSSSKNKKDAKKHGRNAGLVNTILKKKKQEEINNMQDTIWHSFKRNDKGNCLNKRMKEGKKEHKMSHKRKGSWNINQDGCDPVLKISVVLSLVVVAAIYFGHHKCLSYKEETSTCLWSYLNKY